MALRVWLPLNGNIKNQGLDKECIADGTLVYGNGKIGQALYMETASSSNGIYAPKQEKQVFSVMLWFKAPGYTGTTRHICNEGREYNTYGWNIRLVSNANQIAMMAGSGNGAQYTSNFTPDTWYHVAMCRDSDNKIYFYINGMLMSTQTQEAGLDYSESNGYINIGRMGYGSGNSKIYPYQGYINDFRYYDECLSPKQIKEISKGLICHYKLDDPYIEDTINLAPKTTSYSVTYNPTWDTSLNGSIILTPTGWSSGYNTGVTAATTGYHAKWEFDEKNKLIMKFPNLNSVINQKGRWLGISTGGVSTNNILAGEKYTISWWQKTDNLSLAAFGGIYYKKTSDGASNFWDGCPVFGYNTKLNTWEYITHTFTRVSDYVENTQSQSLYVYGYNSTYEGTVYIKDVQLQKEDHATPYTIGTRNGSTLINDVSGNGYSATKNGAFTFNTDSPRYSGSSIFNVNTSYLKLPLLNTSDFKNSFTIIYWAKITDMNGKMVWGFSDGNRLNIYPTGSVICCNTGDGASNPYKKDGTSISYSQWNNGWHQFAMVGDGTSNKLYVDGELQGTATTYKGITGSQIYISGWDTGTNYTWTGGSLSDFRIYATALSADDILTTYKTSGIIDNKNNVYAYEFKEE